MLAAKEVHQQAITRMVSGCGFLAALSKLATGIGLWLLLAVRVSVCARCHLVKMSWEFLSWGLHVVHSTEL